MKRQVNEAKLTGLWARNCDANKQVLISKFAFVPEKLPGLSRNEPQLTSGVTWTTELIMEQWNKSVFVGVLTASLSPATVLKVDSP